MDSFSARSAKCDMCNAASIYRLFDSLKLINSYDAHVALCIIFLVKSIADAPVS